MTELPGNSHMPKKNVKKVVTNPTSERKAPLGRRFSQTFIQGDARSVWSTVFWDVLLPRTKDTVFQMAQEGVSRLLFGDSRSGSRSTGSTNTYLNRYNPDAVMGKKASSRAVSRSHDFRQVLIETRVEAEQVLDDLGELISKFGVATVADFKTMVDLDPDYTDQNWGWDNIGEATVRPVGDRYIIDISRPSPLD